MTRPGRMDQMMKNMAGRELSGYGGNDNCKAYRKAMRTSLFLPICQAIDLSNNFKPNLPAEKQRIEAAGHTERGNVHRIDDRIAISRSLGDLLYKDNNGLGPEQQSVTAFPEVCTEGITQDDQFLIIACEGIWSSSMALAVPVTLKTIEEGENERLDYAVSAMQGHPENMEDAYAIGLNLDAATGTSFVGVYDCHGGPAILKYCARHLQMELCRDEKFCDNIQIAIESTFLRMDEMMKDRAWRQLYGYGTNDNRKTYRKAIHTSLFVPFCQKPAYQRPENDGCCVVLIRGNQIIVGNAGDSRCVLSGNNLEYCATDTDSRASSTRSSTRIANNKSTVENSVPNLRRITKRPTSKRGAREDDDEGSDDSEEQPKTKDTGTYRLRTVVVSCVEDLENLDPNVVRLSISEQASQEGAAEVLREGNRRNFEFDRRRQYYKAVWACIVENTESEERDALDPDYQPFELETGGDKEEARETEEHGETGAAEEESEPETTDGADEEQSEQESEAETTDGADEEESEPETTDVSPDVADDWIRIERTEAEVQADDVIPPPSPPSSVGPVPLDVIPPVPLDGADEEQSEQESEAETTDGADEEESEPETTDVSPDVADDWIRIERTEAEVQADDVIPPPSPPSSVGPVPLDVIPPVPLDVIPPSSSVGPLAIYMPAVPDGEASSSSQYSTAAEGNHSPAPPTPSEPPSSASAAGSVALGSWTDDGNHSPPPPSAPSASSAGPVSLSIWMPPGRPQYAARLAFATVTPAERAVNPSPFIRAALDASLPQVHYNLLPSSRATMLLRFDGRAERDRAVERSPIEHDGGCLDLERAEETSNRYRVPPPFLAAISATDFPPEHWFEENIRAAFRCLGTVIEIDQDCLNEVDYSSVRVVVEVSEQFVPLEIRVTGDDGDGSVVQLRTLRVWDRHLQFDAAGEYIPFFART